jgi:thiol:disulfide interchange protein DsbA
VRSGNKVEVLEFFFYGCSHCFKLHPFISEWEKKMPKDVELTYVPTIFRDSWEPMSRTFYALEALGKQKALHDELFDAWNVKGMDLSDEAKVVDFVAQHGVDRKKFSDAYNSFSMQSKVMRSKQMAQSYNIRGTPTLVVDGKYVIDSLQPSDAIPVLNWLVDKARKERAGKH